MGDGRIEEKHVSNKLNRVPGTQTTLNKVVMTMKTMTTVIITVTNTSAFVEHVAHITSLNPQHNSMPQA